LFTYFAQPKKSSSSFPLHPLKYWQHLLDGGLRRGPGTIAGLDNGDLNNDAPYQGNQRKAYQGRALVVVRSTHNAGEIKLSAAAPGLPPASAGIQTRSAEPSKTSIQVERSSKKMRIQKKPVHGL